jgi:hypothetical protein
VTRALRLAAVLIAVAAIVDPVFALRRPTPLPVEVVLPPTSEPMFADASGLRDAVLAALGDTIMVGRGETPQAVIALGDAKFTRVPEVPVFVVRIGSAPRIQAVSAPAVSAWWGQQPMVSATFRATGMKGRTTTFKLAVSAGATLATIPHVWKTEDETFVASFAFAPSAPGVTRLRVTADSDAAGDSAADIVVNTVDRRARVLVFEPRPSWAAGFVRQAIEADPLFDVRAIARTSRGILTRTAGAPESVLTLDADSVDVVLVGGLEALTPGEIDVLRRFAERRGGSVVLIPDRRLPERVRHAFGLGDLHEALLERPIELRQGNLKVKASEVLRPARSDGSTDAFFVAPRGQGQVLLSLALDAWRYRADTTASFDAFWRSTGAEAAMASVPAVSIRLEPSVVRPGDDVTLTATLRSVEPPQQLPAAQAALIEANGTVQPLRFWPGTTATEYVARFAAPAAGRYNVRVDLEGLPRHDTVLVVAADAARPAADRAGELALLASMTGGHVFAGGDIASVTQVVRTLPAASESRAVHPTRSPWWMLAFTACLCTEWAIRRKRGQR